MSARGWNYRVVRRLVPSNLQGTEHEELYAVHEAYYDENGRVWAITKEPVPLEASSLMALNELRAMLFVAIVKKAVLEYDSIPEPGAVNPADKGRKVRR